MQRRPCGGRGAQCDVRMFVAVWPDDSTLRRLSALPLGPTESLRLVKPGRWHLTLRFLGDVDPVLVPTLVAALEVAAATLPDPIRCEVGPKTAWFGGDRVLQIPVSGLDQAATAIRDATVPVVPDMNPGEPRFTGHLTVARSKRRRLTASERSVLAGIPFATSFAVDSFDLVASQPSTGGNRYTTLGSMQVPREAAPGTAQTPGRP
jgi:2'-5' RNA ligase